MDETTNDIEILTEMVPRRYIVLTSPGRVAPGYVTGGGVVIPPKETIKAGKVKVRIDDLTAFADYCQSGDRYFDRGFIEFSPMAQCALEAMGWATGKTRGGLWAEGPLYNWLSEKGLY